MMVSAISYGNWVTHGGQVGEDQAIACVRAALDEGVTTFDTADVYSMGEAERVLGKALRGVRRDSIEIFTKVFWPTGSNPNNRGLSRKHIIESCESSLERLGTDHLDLLQAHRYDVETPLDETLRAFDDLVRAGKVHYIGVSEWTAAQIAQAVTVAEQLGLDRIVSNQPQYSLLWRVPEAEVIPTSRVHGIGQIVWSPLAQGVLTGKYAPGQAARGRATREPSTSSRGSCATRSSSRSSSSASSPAKRATRRPRSRSPGCSATTTSRARSAAPRVPSRCSRTCGPPTSSSTTISWPPSTTRSSPRCCATPR
jgi:aryl-alcohol dehydrogenase-like predicted oxidoreductase